MTLLSRVEVPTPTFASSSALRSTVSRSSLPDSCACVRPSFSVCSLDRRVHQFFSKNCTRAATCKGRLPREHLNAELEEAVKAAVGCGLQQGAPVLLQHRKHAPDVEVLHGRRPRCLPQPQYLAGGRGYRHPCQH